MIPLIDKENKFYEKQKVCHTYKKEFFFDENEINKFKLYQNVRDHCHYTGKFRGAAHSICNLRFKVPKEIPVVVHNAIYDTHLIIKQLAEQFGGQFDCMGENTKSDLADNLSEINKKKIQSMHGKKNSIRMQFYRV